MTESSGVGTTVRTSADWDALYRRAHDAGLAAAKAVVPEPMVVVGGVPGEAPTRYVVSDGVCGFAWVNVRPSRTGFGKWLKDHGRATHDDYLGGVTLWVHLPGDIDHYGQSMTRKEAYARAFAEVVRAEGVNATAASRMD